MRPWHAKNTTPFDPSDLGKSEGRGERKYAHDLCLQGLDARHNTPGQNPDILIQDGPGREIKEMDSGRRFRISASQDVVLALFRTIFRPLNSIAEEILPEREFELFGIGNIKAVNLRKLLQFGGHVEDFFGQVFDHSKIDKIVLCYPEGYVEFDLPLFSRCFEIYLIDKFVAKVRLRGDVKILVP